MKIAFIGQKGMPASYGGVERHVEELATRLSKMGHEVSVYCRPWYVRMAQSSELRAQSHKGVNLIFLPSLKTKHLDTLSHTFLASWHALFQKYDIIHYQSIGPSALIFFFRLFKGKTKIFSTLHCPDYEHQKWGKISQFLLRLGESIAVRFSDQTITVSKTYQNYLRRRYGKNPILIPNGVNPPQVKKANLITKKWGLTKKSYLLVVSRLIRHKGIHTVISAYQKLKNCKQKLVIVGDTAFTDDYKRELLALSDDNSKIIFTGFQTGEVLAELFSNAALFLQASESEGLSIALLEALSYGVPILVSDIAENLEVAGSLGFYFENKNAEDLKEKLVYLLSHSKLIKHKSQKAKQRILMVYDWGKIAQQFGLTYLNPSRLPLEKNPIRLIDYTLS